MFSSDLESYGNCRLGNSAGENTSDSIMNILEADRVRRNEQYMKTELEKIHTLEIISGMNVETLITCFRAGYTLEPPKSISSATEAVYKLAEKIARESKLPAYFFREMEDSIKKRDKFIETVKVGVDEDGKIVATIDEPLDELLDRYKESEE